MPRWRSSRTPREATPFYLIELARSVATTAGHSDSTYPETLERLLAARIDQLPLAGRELMRQASVLGSSFSRSLAARVLDRSDLFAVDAWEESLGDLIIIEEHTVRFQHDLLRVAAYEGLSVRRRRAVHRRAGAVIEAWGESAPVPDRLAALAFHASGSGLPEGIVRWNRQAAEAAIAKGAMDIAEGLLREVATAQRQIGADPADCCETGRRLAFAAERRTAETALEAPADAAMPTSERRRSG
jgi:hypothetical protein